MKRQLKENRCLLNKLVQKPAKQQEASTKHHEKEDSELPERSKKGEQRLTKEEIQRRQEEEEELRRQINIPLSMQKKRDPEIIEDGFNSSGEDEIKEKENQGYKTKESAKEKKDKKDKKKKEKRKLDDMDENEELDVDKIFKSGPKETIKLEPPSPPRSKEKMSEEPAYFNGFTNNAPKMHLQTVSTNKPKPVAKIQRNQDNDDGDLLGEWEKRYGKGKPATNIWEEKAHDEPQPSKKKTNESKRVNDKPKYVENVLASQPKAHGEDFDDNWDDENEGNQIQSNNKQVRIVSSLTK